MRLRVRLVLSAVFVCFLSTQAAGVSAAEATIDVRVFVASDASNSQILTLRDRIVAAGGVVKDFTAGNTFSVVIAPALLPPIAALPGVTRVQEFLPRTGVPAPVPSRLFGLGVRLPSADEYAFAADELRKSDSSAGKVSTIAPSRLAILRGLLAGRTGSGSAALPSQVDNSLSPHFPPIGDQEGRSSCVAWAMCYYWTTYTQAVDEGLDVSGDWLPRNPECEIITLNPISGKYEFDPVKFAACPPTIDPPRPSRAREHIASPAFIYPLLNNGSDRGVATYYLANAFARLNDVGCASWTVKPYDPWQFTSVVTDWPTEAQWVEALKRRTLNPTPGTLGIQQFDLSATGQLDLLKQHLANGQIAMTAGVIHENWANFAFNPTCQAGTSCAGINNDVLFSDGGTDALGGHAITIVGYDDNKTYLDDQGQQRAGALLIANSAGPGFGTYNSLGSTANPGPDPAKRGFIWIAYDYATAGKSYYGISAYFWRVWTLADRLRYRPRLYAASRLEKPDRSDIGYAATVGLVTAPQFTSHQLFPSMFQDTVNALSHDQRVVIDLTDGLPQVDARRTPPPLLAQFSVGSAGQTGTMGNTEFFWDRTGSGVFASYMSPDPFKAVRRSVGTACTNVPQDGDVNADGVVDISDIQLITSSLSKAAACTADPRDIDRSGSITVMDARSAVVKCTRPGCR